MSTVLKIQTTEEDADKPHLSVVDGIKSKAPELDKRHSLAYLSKALVKYGASDLHLKAGRPPLFRINGRLVAAKMDPIDAPTIREIVKTVMIHPLLTKLEKDRQVDFSYVIEQMGRFRCNVYYQRGELSAAIRMIPSIVPALEELKLPKVLEELCSRPRGLVLVTGATGCGKSTTLAAMVQHINETRYCHILCLEDPIEFMFHDQKSSISQRELGSDFLSFDKAISAALRQDPNVIMIGELRDLETIKIALTAAETGHLVLATLHTNDTTSSVERIVDVFPAEAKNQVRIQLASCLVGVVSQHLLTRVDEKGRVPAAEVMINSPSIQRSILKNELDRIPEMIGNSRSFYKMQTLNQDLERLVNSGQVSSQEALKVSTNPDDLKLLLSGLTREEGYYSEDSASNPSLKHSK